MPEVLNIVIANANEEQVISIPSRVKKLLLQARGYSELKIGFQTGESSTKYFTLKSGSTYFEDQVHGPFTLAIRSDEPNTVLELVTWCYYE